jgi:uncharacterized protein YidB (DUF937 family)
MGLFDNLFAAAKSTALQALEGESATIMSKLESHAPGGIGGLLEQLHAGGLENHISSWMAPGANLPITPEQIRAALSDRHIADLAQSLGLPAQSLLQTLSDHLPALVSQHAAPTS